VQAAAARLGLSASKVGGREAAGGGKAAFHHHAFKDAMSPAAAHRGTERNVVESNASRKPSLAFSFNSLQEEEEELLTYPFPNTGWFAGTVAAMRGTLPLLLPDTVGGIDQGHVCAEAARQRLLAMGLVTVDMHADLSLNMNAAPGRRPAVMAEHLARRLGAVINASSVPNSATSSLRQLFEAAPRRRREEALRHQQRALLAVHFSGPSKDTAFPAARSVLQSYLQYRRAVEEDRRSGSGDGGWDWRDGMELFAVDGSGRCSVVPVSLTCPPGDSF
jgi:hypothetical protein